MERYVRYRAPEGSGQKLIVPPWSEFGQLLSESAAWRRAADVGLLGQPLEEFARDARRELLATAAGGAPSASAAAPLPPDAAVRPIILTGHQPELVHPGVWLKNFAAAKLASDYGGVAVQLVIDADACRSTAIRVPCGNVDHPRFALVEFDRPGAVVPWEERRISDDRCWRTFAERVAGATQSLLADRMLDQWWPSVIEESRLTGGLIGASLARARHALERAWGCWSCELPQSDLCQMSAFRRFTLHLLGELPRFVESYNVALAEYRRSHRLRNHAQPAPDLTVDGQWFEAPYWMWSTADPQRRAVFVRRTNDGLFISDRHGFEGLLPTGALADADALAVLDHWEARGVKLRSRALITTMFARLALADVFLHGIGGARYDEVTDAVCQRFFGSAPPPYATLSGTLRLPIVHPPGGLGEVRQLRQRLRDLQFHPERHVPAAATAAHDTSKNRNLVAEKRRALQLPASPHGASRHQAIVAANRALHSVLQGSHAETERELAASLDRARSNRVLDSREYAFCLFPQSMLQEFLLDFPD